MKCPICKQDSVGPGTVTVTLERGRTIIIVREVPAEVCSSCEEYSLSEAVTERIFESAEAAVQRGAEVEILRYAA